MWYSKCLVFNKKLKGMQRNKKVWPIHMKKISKEIVTGETLDLPEKNFKSTVQR